MSKQKHDIGYQKRARREEEKQRLEKLQAGSARNRRTRNKDADDE